MKSSVYISAEQIQVLGFVGKTVQSVATFPLPEGIMFNGNIMDAAFLSECLAGMKADYPALFKGGVSLVVDGSSILTRRLTTPRLRHGQYLQRVRDDFVDSISDTHDLVCTYKKLGDGTILGCGVSKAQVDSYLSTFKAAGIKIASIHVGAELLYAMVKATPQMQDATVVVNVLDGNTMLSAVFVKGSNIMMQRTRLYGDEKEAVHGQIIESLSNLNQFAQSQKHDAISHSFYLGMSGPDVYTLGEMNIHEGIRISPLHLETGSDAVPPEAHFASLNILYGQEGMDLIKARRALDSYIRSKKPKKHWIPALAGYALVMLVVAGYLWWQLRDVDGRITEIYDFIHRPDIIATHAELVEMIRITNDIERISRQFNDRMDWEASLPTAASHLMERILFGHGMDVYVTAFDFNEATGVARVSAITRDARMANDYIHSLYDRGIAENVVYTGYTVGPEGLFSFSIDIYLAVEEGYYVH
ncbi:MAG: hypothetical protein FWB88_03750 [Defluviitaleaceae bacterium]|nr:hypothetical protein [Defluviitaleaceae bacterium]MCL2239068.1 hypothetical protein [Defluviitaleaceae bacterium]